VHPAVLRFELLKGHYRSHTNFTAKGLLDSASTVRRWTEFGQRLAAACGGEAATPDPEHPVLRGFMEALADDLNISAALAVVLPWVAAGESNAATGLGVFRQIDQVLGLAPAAESAVAAAAAPATLDVEGLCRRLDAARAARDFEAADALRKELLEAGYEVRSTPAGTTAQRRLA
jgi:cysteinyl-tRNA synthetase